MKELLTLSLALTLIMAPVSAHALLIDDIAGATFAFSLSRYLRTAEIGNPVARFRESATGNERDFKLDGSNVLVSDDVDEYTVSEFLALTSATTTYVVSVYDQSGNGNTFTNATVSEQPILTTSSALGGIAAIDFDTGQDRLVSGSISITSANGIEVHTLVEPTSIDASSAIIFGGGASSLAYVDADTTGWHWQPDFSEDVYGSTAPTNNTGYMMTYQYLGSSIFVIEENCTEIANEVNAGGPIDWRTGPHGLGGHGGSGTQFPWEGLIAELVFYNGLYSAGDLDDIQQSLATQGGVSGCTAAPSTSLPYRIYNLGQMLLTGGTFILQ